MECNAQHPCSAIAGQVVTGPFFSLLCALSLLLLHLRTEQPLFALSVLVTSPEILISNRRMPPSNEQALVGTCVLHVAGGRPWPVPARASSSTVRKCAPSSNSPLEPAPAKYLADRLKYQKSTPSRAKVRTISPRRTSAPLGSHTLRVRTKCSCMLNLLEQPPQTPRRRRSDQSRDLI